jgi:hypothetical protein
VRRTVVPTKVYSYLVEGLPQGQWRWTVFGDSREVVRSGNAKSEHEARMAAMQAIHDLQKQDSERERRG